MKLTKKINTNPEAKISIVNETINIEDDCIVLSPYPLGEDRNLDPGVYYLLKGDGTFQKINYGGNDEVLYISSALGPNVPHHARGHINNVRVRGHIRDELSNIPKINPVKPFIHITGFNNFDIPIQYKGIQLFKEMGVGDKIIFEEGMYNYCVIASDFSSRDFLPEIVLNPTGDTGDKIRVTSNISLRPINQIVIDRSVTLEISE